MADPGVDRGKAYLVDAGTAGFTMISRKARVLSRRLALPPGLEGADVRMEESYDDEDENMRMVRAVNEDDPDCVKVTVTKRVPVAVDRITVSVNLEVE